MIKQLCLVLVFAASALLAGPRLYAQQAADVAVTPEQAIAHLDSLVPVYQIELTDTERSQVVSVCRQLQTSTLTELRSQITTSMESYTNVTNSIDLSIRFTANALRGMSEDSSSMDLASFHLNREARSLESAYRVYERSLEELLVIDCQVFPVLFAAGLEESRERKKLVESAAQELTDYIDGSLAGAFASVQKRLNQVEGAL